MKQLTAFTLGCLPPRRLHIDGLEPSQASVRGDINPSSSAMRADGHGASENGLALIHTSAQAPTLMPTPSSDIGNNGGAERYWWRWGHGLACNEKLLAWHWDKGVYRWIFVRRQTADGRLLHASSPPPPPSHIGNHGSGNTGLKQGKGGQN